MTVIEDIASRAERQCGRSHSFGEPLKHFDSLDYVEMVMWCENTYGIEISDGEAEKLKTIADYARLVNKKKVVYQFPCEYDFA